MSREARRIVSLSYAFLLSKRFRCRRHDNPMGDGCQALGGNERGLTPFPEAGKAVAYGRARKRCLSPAGARVERG